MNKFDRQYNKVARKLDMATGSRGRYDDAFITAGYFRALADFRRMLQQGEEPLSNSAIEKLIDMLAKRRMDSAL